jgi:hypothetical protein
MTFERDFTGYDLDGLPPELIAQLKGNRRPKRKRRGLWIEFLTRLLRSWRRR